MLCKTRLWYEGRVSAALVCFLLVGLLAVGPVLAAEDVLLRMIAWQHEGERALSGTTDLLNAFHRSNPDLRVNLNHDRWEQALPNIRYWCGSLKQYAPDLTVMPDVWLPRFAGSLLPLDEFLSDGSLAGLMPSVLERGRVNGKLLGLPWIVRARVLYYRQDLFDKLKLQPPQTLAELREVAVALREEPGLYPLGLPAASGGGGADAYWGLYLAGAEEPDDRGKRPLETKRAAAAMQYWLDLQHLGLTQPQALSWSSAELDQAFADGKLGMVFSGPALGKYLKTSKPDLKFGVAPLPGDQGQVGQLSSEVVVIFNTTSRAQAAVRFAAFLASPEAQRALWLMGGLPTHLDHAREAARDEALKPYVLHLQQAQGLPLDEPERLTWVVERALWLGLSGRSGAAEALATAAREEQRPPF